MPIGTITLKVYHYRDWKRVTATGKHIQKIKSLNGILPPPLECNPSLTSLDYGEQNIDVFLSDIMWYPGFEIGKENPPTVVLKFEWKIPKGWKLRSGQQPTSSGTYITDGPKIQLITNDIDGGTVSVRGLSGGGADGCWEAGDHSLYNSITFTRPGKLTLENYPKSVPLGEINTYQFSVKMNGITSFDWSAPSGWKINGGSNVYRGGKNVQITTNNCMTMDKVKVKMSKGSSWTEFPTVVMLPTINIPKKITQYQTITLSLNNISDDKITSVEWFVNGNSIGKTKNKSALSYQIPLYGQMKISAILVINGCMSISIPAITINVNKAPSPYLSGPSAVCNQATYTVENLPPGAKVQWQVHPELYTYRQTNNSISVSKQSLTSSMKGGWIKATITGNGTTLRKDDILLWKSGITQTDNLLVGQLDASGGQVEAVYPIQELGRNFQWSASNNWEATIQGHHFTDFSGNPQSNASSVYITVRFNDPCGSETIIYKEFELPSTYSFSLSPNPVTDITTLQWKLSREEISMNNNSQVTQPVIWNRSTYEIQLWSGMTMLRSFRTNEPTFQIPMAGLPAGLYFVRVVKDGQTYTQKLIKK